MTVDEFNDTFLPHLLSRFPSVLAWLAIFPKRFPQPPDAPVSQQMILDAWHYTLSETPLAEACRAVDLVTAGDEPSPQSIERWPATIRRVAKCRTATDAGEFIVSARDESRNAVGLVYRSRRAAEEVARWVNRIAGADLCEVLVTRS